MFFKKLLTVCLVAAAIMVGFSLPVLATNPATVTVSSAQMSVKGITPTSITFNIAVQGSIKNLKLMYATGNTTSQVTVNSNTGGDVTVQGLTPGTLYSCYITYEQSDNNATVTMPGQNVTTPATSGSSPSTPGQAPLVTTDRVTSIRSNSASVRIDVTDDGGSNVTRRGAVYSSSSRTPSLDNNDEYQNASGSGEGNATVSLSGLRRNTTYYVRAYATNSYGTSYGTVLDFKTSSSVDEPEAVTEDVDEITGSSADIYISTYSTADITERGVLYSATNNSPELRGSRVSKQITSVTNDDAVVMIAGLSRDTTYYVRAYATNRHGTGYGEVLDFTTEEDDWRPEVRTVSADMVSNDTMDVRIDVVRDNGSNIEERGVVYSQSDENPKVGSSRCYTEDVSGRTGSTTVTVDGLSRSGVYYVRAYAENADGIGYGEVIAVGTDSSRVETYRATKVTATGATVEGVAYADDDRDISECGFVYSATRQMPTIDDTGVTAGNLNYGEFSADLTRLVGNETYYVRAYIRVGGSYYYGGAINFTTTGTPTLTVQFRLADNTQIGEGTLTRQAGTAITSADLVPILPARYQLDNPNAIYTVPDTDGAVTVRVRLGMSYSVLQPTRPAGTVPSADKSSNALSLNGRTYIMPAVMIDGYNWLKLRDVAFLLNGTDKQFSVGYDTTRNVASISSLRPYVAAGGEMADTLASKPRAYAASAQLVVDGSAVSIAAYTIDNYNYFRLRDIAIMLDFGTEYSNGIVTLRLDRPYSE